MCYSDDARPPLPPVIGGAAANTTDLRLKAADGTEFMAYAARSAQPNGRGMVILPDVRGLHTYYKELADRFAEIGVDAVAIDFFARTAPSEDRSEAFDFMSQVPLTKPETLSLSSTAVGFAVASAEPTATQTPAKKTARVPLPHPRRPPSDMTGTIAR